jgi:hypothetical protein
MLILIQCLCPLILSSTVIFSEANLNREQHRQKLPWAIDINQWK